MPQAPLTHSGKATGSGVDIAIIGPTFSQSYKQVGMRYFNPLFPIFQCTVHHGSLNVLSPRLCESILSLTQVTASMTDAGKKLWKPRGHQIGREYIVQNQRL